MHRTSVGMLLLTCCVLVAPLARGAHTVTLPGPPPEWRDTPIKHDPASDAAKAAQTLGIEVASALNSDDARAAADLVNARALGTRVGASMYTDVAQQHALVAEFNTDVVKNAFDAYCQALSTSHGSAKFMRVIMRDGQPRALVRMDAGREGVVYLELLVERNDAGAYQVIDWYDLNQGLLQSESLGATFKLLNDPDENLLRRMFASTAFSREMLEKFQRIATLEKQEDHAAALAVVKQLPSEVADSLPMVKLRFVLARRAKDSEEYDRALDTMARKYGNDPSVAWNLVAYYLRNKQFDRVQAEFNLLESRVGSDGVMNAMRSDFYQVTGDYSAAVAAARKAVELEPDLQRAWFSLAKGYVLLKDYSLAVATFQEMQTRFGVAYSRQQFVGMRGWDAFVQSDQFQKWLPQ